MGNGTATQHKYCFTQKEIDYEINIILVVNPTLFADMCGQRLAVPAWHGLHGGMVMDCQ